MSKDKVENPEANEPIAKCDPLAMSIEKLIHPIRGQQVMLDSDLAKLYGVETRALNQAVKRNIERFPEDFMFQLFKDEFDSLRSQIVISNLKSQNVTSLQLAIAEAKTLYK